MADEVTRPRRRQAERRQESERRLLLAGAELIAEVGPTRMTLSDIGVRAGYSRGLTTQHFGSKSALIRRIMDAVTEEFHRDLAEHDPALDAKAGIREIVNTYYRGLAKNDPMIRARVALWAAAAVGGTDIDQSHVLEAEDRFRNEIRTRLASGAERHEIDVDVDVEGFTSVLIGMLRGVAVQSLLDSTIDLDRAAEETLAMVDSRLSRPV